MMSMFFEVSSIDAVTRLTPADNWIAFLSSQLKDLEQIESISLQFRLTYRPTGVRKDIHAVYADEMFAYTWPRLRHLRLTGSCKLQSPKNLEEFLERHPMLETVNIGQHNMGNLAYLLANNSALLPRLRRASHELRRDSFSMGLVLDGRRPIDTLDLSGFIEAGNFHGMRVEASHRVEKLNVWTSVRNDLDNELANNFPCVRELSFEGGPRFLEDIVSFHGVKKPANRVQFLPQIKHKWQTVRILRATIFYSINARYKGIIVRSLADQVISFIPSLERAELLCTYRAGMPIEHVRVIMTWRHSARGADPSSLDYRLVYPLVAAPFWQNED